ncbi:MAG TPA: hypothetical protein VFA46_02805 [Actinomycetes bacterium]|nr:hypothetical protein [Actinomycetes bacterium]
MAYCPRSSLPATVLAWLAARPAHRAQAVSSQQRPDRRGTHPDAELTQLPADPHAAPPALSRAIRRISAAVRGSVGGRPGVRSLP